MRLSLLVACLWCTSTACAPAWKYDPAALVQAIRGSAELPLPAAPKIAPSDLLILHARPWNPTQEHPSASTNLLVRNGVLAQWDAPDAVDGVPTLDAQGAYLLPGLMDMHVHLSMAPGAALRGDDAVTTAQLRHQHLRAYLAYGVTTILDPAVDAVVARQVLAARQQGFPGPDYLHLGPVFSTPGGYMEDLFPPGIAGPQDIAPHVETLVQSQAVGIKLTVEPGMMSNIWNVHPTPLLAAASAAAGERGLRTYVHAMTQPTWEVALSLKPHALVHHPETADATLVAETRRSGAYVITTLSPWDVSNIVRETVPSAPWQDAAVPPLVRATLRDEASLQRYNQGALGELVPSIPRFMLPALSRLSTTGLGHWAEDRMLQPRLKSSGSALRALGAAGVPLVMGSDSGNWPLFPYYLHGPTTWRELVLLERAGFTPREVLRMATLNASAMVERPDRGCLTTGCRADLILLAKDPSTGLAAAMQSLTHTIKDGVARTPTAWLAE